jgi:hypothetical protein
MTVQQMSKWRMKITDLLFATGFAALSIGGLGLALPLVVGHFVFGPVRSLPCA